MVEEYAGGSLAARYDYGDDLVRMDRGSGLYYYLYDGLGSTRQLVGAGGAATDGYWYDAYGEGLSHTGTTQNPFLFNAQQFDAASGRFLSQDPYRQQVQVEVVPADLQGVLAADQRNPPPSSSRNRRACSSSSAPGPARRRCR